MYVRPFVLVSTWIRDWLKVTYHVVFPEGHG